MTINAEHSRNRDLVNRYAARARARHSGVTVPTRRSRRSHGIHTFGRRPVSRKRPGVARSHKALTTLMATAIIAAGTPAVTASAGGYEVQPGDTLTKIAQSHGLSVEELAQMNDIDDPDRLLTGAEIRLSEQSPDPDDVQVGDTVYQVREGDTLFAIATEHGLTVEDLLAINEIEDENLVFAGDHLIIPTSVLDDVEPSEQEPAATVAPDSGEVETVIDRSYVVSLHLVAPGETVGSIAQRYGLSEDQFMQANELTDPAQLRAGEMVRIPDASWNPQQQQQEDEQPYVAESAMLEGMPVQQQALPLSSALAAASITTAYWGHQVSEWVFIENTPANQNPHRGFRGDVNAEAGGTSNYGIYPKPLSTILANYGFIGDEFYTMGDPQELKERIDRGEPVLAWMTSGATHQNRFYEWYQGERFALVPYAHVVVVYGYDANNVHVADPGTGQHVAYSWSEFINSWSTFDGMSMAVYPKG